MVKLYGFAVSNYFNMVKHALLAKGIEFEEVSTYPGGDSGYLAKSPMGKVPCIETGHGALCETSVILDYIESAWPDRPLSPPDLWGRAKMKEFMKVVELYIELQGRRLMPAIMGGATLDEATRSDVRAIMEKGARSIGQLARFEPYVLGESMTMADIFLHWSLGLAQMAAGPEVLDWNLFEHVDGLEQWEAMIAATPIAMQLHEAMQKELPAFMEQISARS